MKRSECFHRFDARSQCSMSRRERLADRLDGTHADRLLIPNPELEKNRGQAVRKSAVRELT